MNTPSQRPSCRLALADLIDLEAQLERDRKLEEEDRRALRERDAAIGREIAPAASDDRALFLAWLDRLRPAGQMSPGQKTQAFLDAIASVLFVAGLFLGGSTVAGWLLYNLREPINVIFFWSALAGVQILLLIFWLILVMPAAWLRFVPGARAAQLVFRVVESALPVIVGMVTAKLSPEYRLLLAEIRGAVKRWEHLYSRLRLWLAIRLTQVFALAYNLGAIVVFVALSYGTDPAFGWKSRMMTAEQLHTAAQVISLPWRGFVADGAPSLEDVVATAHTSLDPDFIPERERAAGERDVWASWWPFLFGSLLAYGLLPRIVTYGVAAWQVRRHLDEARLNHSEFDKLRRRLVSPTVTTQSPTPPSEPPTPDLAELPPVVDETPPAPAGAACAVIRWAGVPLSDDEAARLMADRLAARVVAAHAAGDLDVAVDEAALAAVRDSGAEEAAVLVESWEPPVGDYLDFLSRLRQELGADRMIRVVLYNRGADGQPAPPRAQDAQVWRRQIRTIDDPWLGVDDFLEEPAA